MPELFAEKSIEHVKQQLRNPEVQLQLGKAASTLLEISDGLYVPSDDANGIIDLKGESTPVVALGTGKSLQLSRDTFGFSEKQHTALSKKGISASEQDKMEATLEDKTFVMPNFANAGVNGLKGVYKTGNRDIRVVGRPIVVLNTSNNGIHAENNTVLAHELVHINQNERRPYKTEYEQVRREVEANRIQARIEAGLGLPSTKASRVTKAYERFVANGGDIKTQAGQIEFENYLRQHKANLLSPHTTLPGIIPLESIH